MAGFEHGGQEHREPVDLATAGRNARLGVGLFAVYCLVYAGFVLLNAFDREGMRRTISGINLAVWYGFGLIGGALLLALVYGWLCRRPVPSDAKEQA